MNDKIITNLLTPVFHKYGFIFPSDCQTKCFDYIRALQKCSHQNFILLEILSHLY